MGDSLSVQLHDAFNTPFKVHLFRVSLPSARFSGDMVHILSISEAWQSHASQSRSSRPKSAMSYNLSTGIVDCQQHNLDLDAKVNFSDASLKAERGSRAKFGLLHK